MKGENTPKWLDFKWDFLLLYICYFCYFQSSTETVLAVEFHPFEKNSIVSCGKSQISFWSLEGGTLSKKQGIYDVRRINFT